MLCRLAQCREFTLPRITYSHPNCQTAFTTLQRLPYTAQFTTLASFCQVAGRLPTVGSTLLNRHYASGGRHFLVHVSCRSPVPIPHNVPLRHLALSETDERPRDSSRAHKACRLLLRPEYFRRRFGRFRHAHMYYHCTVRVVRLVAFAMTQEQVSCHKRSHCDT